MTVTPGLHEIEKKRGQRNTLNAISQLLNNSTAIGSDYQEMDELLTVKTAYCEYSAISDTAAIVYSVNWTRLLRRKEPQKICVGYSQRPVTKTLPLRSFHKQVIRSPNCRKRIGWQSVYSIPCVPGYRRGCRPPKSPESSR